MSEHFGLFLERGLHRLGVGPLDDAVVFGSSVMKLHGLREEVGDVDLFVPPRVYARLRADRERWWEKRPSSDDPAFLEGIGGEHPSGSWLYFHAFHAWTARDRWIDVPEAVATAERVCGVKCVRLDMVASMKREALRVVRARGIEVKGSAWEKHERDLALLERHTA